MPGHERNTPEATTMKIIARTPPWLIDHWAAYVVHAQTRLTQARFERVLDARIDNYTNNIVIIRTHQMS